nr:carbohydrate binding family 9 domain-containing protein [Acidobacteriota bacterium]
MVPILAMSMILACGQAPEAGPPVVHASLVSDAPRVDGVLEEPAWQSAHVVGGFRQREPNEGAPATEATEVRVVYTRDALFIGIMAFDRDPGRVLARVLRRDRLIKAGSDGAYEFAGDDTVAIVIDPFQDHRNAFLFATNANGAEFDALVTDESAVLNADWRGVWKVAARRTRDGWSAELAIPFRTLRYPQTSEPARWGFNAERVIRRKNEHTLWAGWQRAGGGLHRVSRAGLVDDLAGLPRSSLHAEVKPYGLVGGVRDTSSTVREWQHLWRVGGDLKWQPVPGLTLDATARPDFTQVESDQQVINLTRFELYFPEKREFFLENAGVFEFGTRGSYETPPFLLFFSRRIGAGPDGGEVPVLGGTRLTGRAGRQTIGVLAVVTEDAAGQPLTSFAVARIKRDVGRRGYVGAMAADRRTSAAASTDAGIDGSLWPTAHLNVQGFLARTKASSRPGLAGRVAAEYSGDPWYAYGEYLVVGRDAQTAMGFVTRTDMRRSSAKVQYTVRPHLAGVRQVSLYAGGKYLTRIDGKPQDGN